MINLLYTFIRLPPPSPFPLIRYRAPWVQRVPSTARPPWYGWQVRHARGWDRRRRREHQGSIMMPTVTCVGRQHHGKPRSRQRHFYAVETDADLSNGMQ